MEDRKKKVSLHCFLADQKIASAWEKNAFDGLACCPKHTDYRPSKTAVRLAV